MPTCVNRRLKGWCGWIPTRGWRRCLRTEAIGAQLRAPFPAVRISRFSRSGLPLPLALSLIGPQMPGILAQATSVSSLLVVVDSPPLLGCAETLELAASIEVAVLAVRSGQTPMKVLGEAVQTLRRVNVPIAGIVLNASATVTDATYKAYARYYTTLGSA